jgi:hypothetical protein
MKIDEFQKRLNLHGADLSRWPAQDIKLSLALIQQSPEAAKLFAAAEKLDHVLRHYCPENAGSSALAKKIIRQAQQAPQRQSSSFRSFSRYLYVQGGGLLIAAVLGFMIGFSDQGMSFFSSGPNFLADAQHQIIQDENDDIL